MARPAYAPRHLAVPSVVLLLALSGCGSTTTGLPGTPAPSSAAPSPASPAPTNAWPPVPASSADVPSPMAAPDGSPASGSSPVVVTFRVADGSTYRVELVKPSDIAIAREILAGTHAPMIPNGLVVRGSASVNTGYTWHIDPNDFEWAEMTAEVCDGVPAYVENGTITSDRFCPWTARVVAIQPLR